MAIIRVRDVSEETLATLKVRAARAGQSLQSYVRQLLEREAALLTPEEAAERAREIAARSAVTADDAIEAVARGTPRAGVIVLDTSPPWSAGRRQSASARASGRT